ncbi:MAG: hypothetical protein DMF82_20315 [Acidobacteria bacterium]|nr:MAG: hypothetical protein DMF82_20315 [Acidobacteriota bacterium]
MRRAAVGPASRHRSQARPDRLAGAARNRRRAPIVTAGGLVFIAATNDGRFRAFDARTGRELWVTRLEASGHATPITYRGPRSGKQIVVIAAGGGGSFSDTSSDVIAAYALPD